MILLLIQFLTQLFGYKMSAVFSYFSTRMILASLTSLGLSVFFGPYFIRKLYALKVGQPIRDSEDLALLAELHRNKKNTPTMGGVLILFAMVISLLLWMDLTHVFTLILLLTTLILGFLGGIDDYLKLKYKNAKGLSGKKKLAVQCVFSGLLALYLVVPSIHEHLHLGKWYTTPKIKEHLSFNLFEDSRNGIEHPSQTSMVARNVPFADFASRIYIPFYKEPLLHLSGIFLLVSVLFVIFVVTGSSNAVNLTDGLDGLAAGCLIMVAACLALIAFVSNHIDIASYLNILYIEGSGEIAIYLCAFIGACLGFLWYNGHPAQLFMGDTGSLALGGIIGVSAVLLKREFLLALVGGIFVMEALSVIIQVGSFRFRNKKRVFLCAPLHHHFEYKGWPETKVVIRFWIIGLLLAIIGVASLKFQ
jgi:phospho-N-acetylmuramoyl-pentapeptide-transferase